MVIFAAAIGMALTSCIEDDFTTSSSDVLEFSTDTLAFDTVLTEEGTATRRFMVYNRHKKMINISSITLDGGNPQVKFYLNVDGMSGEAFNNVEIRGEDSRHSSTPLAATCRWRWKTRYVSSPTVWSSKWC